MGFTEKESRKKKETKGDSGKEKELPFLLGKKKCP